MDTDKLTKVLLWYEAYLLKQPPFMAPYCTLRDMVAHARDHVEEGRIEKAHRWLGFIQGVFYMNHDFDIATLKAHNRS